MLEVYLYSFGSVLIVSGVALVGILTVSVQEVLLRKYVFLLVSLAVGALLGDAFLHLIPEAYENGAEVQTSLLILLGIIAFFVFEKLLHWHHHAHGEHDRETIHATGKMVLVSDSVHNLIDGMIIGASYLASIPVGLATTLAVIFHEIPQEIGDYGVLVNSGYSRRRALWLNFVTALFSILGLVVALILNNMVESLVVWFVPLAAGGFIYVALSDLIPELHKIKDLKHSAIQLSTVLLGIGAMLLLLFLE